MDEDWSHNDVLQKDCFISAAAGNTDHNDISLSLSTFDPNDVFDDIFTKIKMEPSEETSDYHGSSSGSPSSSLSSPNNLKDEPLGLDVNFCVPFTNTNFSPAPGSSHSPGFGMMNGGGGQHSPLPPVGHFSHHMHPQQLQMSPGLSHHAAQNLHQQHQQHYGHSQNLMCRDAMYYEGIGGMGLAVAQQQLKSRNKMHEMAVKQRLISDQFQGVQGSGEVQLSSEERRTLVQEGYAIPSRLPLTKNEEEALKIVRRKIKNKLSAQESRRKRKEYLDALEVRVQGCVQENNMLRNRIRQLEAANRDLTMQNQQYEEQISKLSST